MCIRDSICFTAPDTEANMATLRDTTSSLLDTWLANFEKSGTVDFQDREAQAARDLSIRREIALRDPMNAMVERMYGTELSARLVNALWGGERVLPRPDLS